MKLTKLQAEWLDQVASAMPQGLVRSDINRVLISLQKKGLVVGEMSSQRYRRRWVITDAGREALAIVAANNGGE